MEVTSKITEIKDKSGKPVGAIVQNSSKCSPAEKRAIESAEPTVKDVIALVETFKPYPEYAHGYANAIHESFAYGVALEGDGLRGVGVQILYFLNNVKAKGEEQKAAKKKLQKLAAKFTKR